MPVDSVSGANRTRQYGAKIASVRISKLKNNVSKLNDGSLE